MPLLKNDGFVTDTWTRLDDETALPATGAVVVTPKRLVAEWPELSKRKDPPGVALSNTDAVDALLPYLPHLALIILPFPAFADGRSYSLARRLRNAGFAGDLRASGNVLPDQLQSMRQVGFTSFEVSDRFPLETWQKAARQMSLAYQRGLVRQAGEREVWSQRYRDAAPWSEQPHAG